MGRTLRASFCGLLVALFGLTACLDGSSTSSSSAPLCVAPFTKTLTATINGNQNLYFNVNDLAFLDTPGLELNDLDLDVIGSGKHDKVGNYYLAFNGIKAARHDGQCAPESFDDYYDNDAKEDRCHGHFKLQRFFLNGALPFDLLLLGLRLNHGQLKLGLLGGNYRVVSASLVVTGIIHQKCPQPTPSTTPTPTPAPLPPTTTLNSMTPSANPTNSTSISFTFSSDRATNTTMCSLDDGAFNTCTSPQSYSNLGNGSHKFQVYSKTAQGLTDTPVSYNWAVDTVAPTVTITNAGSLLTLTNSNSISFEFSSTEQGKLYCSLDGIPQMTCTSPWLYQNLGDGSHTFSVMGQDLVGNQSQPATFTWTIDTQAPTTSITYVAPTATFSNATEKHFEFVASESANFSCSVDNGSFTSCVSPVDLTNLAEGNHWFAVQATDAAGNTGLPVTYSWMIDLTPPAITVSSTSPAQGLTSSHGITVDFSVNEPGDVECSLDGAAPSACSSPYSSPMTTEGSHTLTIQATDLAGNASDLTTLSWTMDFTPPFISFGAITPSSSQYINVTDLNVEVIASELTSLSTTLDGQDLGETSSPITLSNLAEGAHTLIVTGYDRAGNAANSIEHDFVIDLTAPVVTLTPDDNTSPTRLDSRSFTMTASEDVTFQCELDGAGLSSCSSSASLSGLADGEHTYSVQARDTAGNLSDLVSSSWTVDTLPPTTSVTATQTSNTAVSFAFTSSESPVTYTCALDSASLQSCTSPVNYSGLQTGTHSFIVYSTDLAGNTDPTGAAYNFTVQPALTTQITSASVTASLTNINSMNFTFAADQTGVTFVCSLNGSTPAACSSPILYSSLADGNYTFMVQAVDQFGQIDPTGASHAWTVDTTAPHTTVSASQVDSSITFTLGSSEFPATFTCAMDGGAAAACTSPKSYSGIAVGSHTFKVKATDAAGNTDSVGASYSFSVLPPITTQITSINPGQTTTPSHTMTFGFTASQTGATFVCSLNGATATACTSPMSYSSLADGAYTFKVQAVDQFGVKDQTGASYSWTVDSTPPVITSTTITVTTTSIMVNWTTNEPATTDLLWGQGSALGFNSGEITTLVTTHSVRLSGLSPSTTYSVEITGKDRAGNVYTGPKHTATTSN